ncbi:MAG: hypothetical protein V3T86_14330 [Planctomycetota bacterium]
MEGGTFLDDKVQDEFKRFIEIRLHTDGGGSYAETSRANKAILADRFGTGAIPHYVVLDPTGTKVLWQESGAMSAEEIVEGLKSAPQE